MQSKPFGHYYWKWCVSWPDEAEREQIAGRIHERFHFLNCLGMIDDTLLPMEFKPANLVWRNISLTRKSNYAVHMLVVCDDQARIHFYTAGWPGSIDANHTWRFSDLSLHAAEFSSSIHQHPQEIVPAAEEYPNKNRLQDKFGPDLVIHQVCAIFHNLLIKHPHQRNAMRMKTIRRSLKTTMVSKVQCHMLSMTTHDGLPIGYLYR